MIIRITFLDEKNEQYQMLFGNSYKKWQDQVFEYIYRCFCSRDNPKPRKYSDMKFIEEDVEYVEKIIRKEF